MNFQEMQKAVHQNSVDKGFHEGEPDIPKMLCLIHSEVSECLEADRNGLHAPSDPRTLKAVEGWVGDGDYRLAFKTQIKDSFADELADVVIRCMDTAGRLGIDLEKHIEMKHRYNTLRPHKHGKQY